MPDGVVESMIFKIENHGFPSYYDLHIKNFNSDELKFYYESSAFIVNIFLKCQRLAPYGATDADA